MDIIRTKIQIPDPDNEGKFIYKQRKVSATLNKMLNVLNFDDMYCDFANGKLYMRDGKSRWQGRGIYRYILRECLHFDENGLIEGFDIDPKMLSDFLLDAENYGLKLSKEEQKAILQKAIL